MTVYGENDTNAVFSGRRTHRGLYRRGTEREINADINGKTNILRKAVPDAFDKVEDSGYLEKPRTFRVDDINHRSRPVEGVVAM